MSNRKKPRKKAHLSSATMSELRSRKSVGSSEDQVRQHLAGCDEYSARVDDRSVDENPGVRGPSYSTVLDRVFEAVVRESVELAGERVSARALVAELRALAENQQRLLVRNSQRYQSWALVEQLLQESRALWAEDPELGEGLASLASEVASHLDATGYRLRLLLDLKAEAWSYIANCRRIRSDLSGAGAAFQCAENLLARGTGDAIERARFLDLKASFLRAARRFDEAEAALLGAIAGFRAASDHHLEGRTLLVYAKTLKEKGSIHESLEVLKQAESLIDFEREPYLEFLYRFAVVNHLVELGANDEAQKLLPEVRELARERALRLDKLRLLWTEGLIRRNRGQFELAEQALRQVREGFISASIAYDVALVSLDLATLLLQKGRSEEVRRLAVETMPIFASLKVQRELIAAWGLFLEAAKRDAATLTFIDRISVKIRRAREDSQATP